MADKFGFTDFRAERALSYYDFEDKHTALKEWYDGYTFGTAAGLFNPWSVFKCLRHRRCIRALLGKHE